MSQSEIDKRYKELYAKALCIAFQAHSGQTDKGGMPYVLHPIRVSDKCTTKEAKIAALLHDVLEDSEYTAKDLREAGFPEAAVVLPVILLTRGKNESYNEYLSNISLNRTATEVKIADLEDNMNLSRLDTITEEDIKRSKKYLRAYEKLRRKASEL